MSTDIHDKIRSEVERRLAIARAATPGPWRLGDWTADYGTEERIPTDIEHAPDYAAFPTRRLRDVHCTLVLPIEDGDRDDVRPNLDHILLHDPADAIRRYEYALKVLDRHADSEGRCPTCMEWCRCDELAYIRDCGCRGNQPQPCPEITDLAESLGIDAGGQP